MKNIPDKKWRRLTAKQKKMVKVNEAKRKRNEQRETIIIIPASKAVSSSTTQ